MITEQIKKEFSKALSEIPTQMGINIAHGNRLFANWKQNTLKKLSKKHNVPLSELETYYTI